LELEVKLTRRLGVNLAVELVEIEGKPN